MAVALPMACAEDLESSAGCPLLCTDQGGEIVTVVIDPVVLDTTVSGLTGLGTEGSILLASRGDTLDTRAILRFDSIPTHFAPAPSDTSSGEIKRADSVRLRMRVVVEGGKIPESFAIEAYDVDTTGAVDTVASVVASLFRPDRLIGTNSYAGLDVGDTLDIALPSSAILTRTGGRLRIGLRARSTESVQLNLITSEGGFPPQLSFRASLDTLTPRIVLAPFSRTPEDQPEVALSVADYMLVVRAPPPASPQFLAVGGVPVRRTYLRFDIPARIIDSADVVRASLLLTQVPNRTLDGADTILVVPYISLATALISDIGRAVHIVAQASADSLRVMPQDSGLKVMDIAPALSQWRAQRRTNTPNALVLISAIEGSRPLEAIFFSTEAAPELRPRLRISYSVRSSRGLP